MKNLTGRYSATQFTYWASYIGIVGFATVYLLERGLSSGVVGTLLAVAGILSCLTQPVLAAAIDKAERFVLVRVLIALSLAFFVCFGMQLVPGIPAMVLGLLYVAGIWCTEAMSPLLNALSVGMNHAGYKINFGVARGIGSGASAVFALVTGSVIAKLGVTWMLLVLLALRLLCFFTLLTYPQVEKAADAERKQEASCTIAQFALKYKWFCLSLLGIGFLAMFHAMTENYLIAIVGRFGGDSSHVGRAIFIAGTSATPVIFFFDAIKKRIRESWLIKIAAVSFLLKAILFCFAGSVSAVYLLQLFHITSYGLLAPAMVCFADTSVRKEDMVKGQSFMTAAYALGSSAGNFAGGLLLESGVSVMLLAGVGIAVIGTIILFTSVERK